MKTVTLLLACAVSALGAVLSDPLLTPGDSLLEATSTQICVPGYAKKHRRVTLETKRAVFERYSLDDVPGKYEVDHLVSLELGGSNDVKNLWPQAYEPRPGAHEKDKVENRLHRCVCEGTLPLKEAQHIIATNWLLAYEQLQMGLPCPLIQP